MKNLRKIILISGIIFSVISCSSDDTQNENTNYVLPKKFVQTNSQGTITNDAYYSNNKIINEVASNGFEGKYYYTGDLITKFERYQNSVLKETYIYSYNNGKVISCNINVVDYYNGTLTINYNQDGTITYNTSFVYPPSNVAENKSYTATITNNEIATFTENGSNVIYTYFYDSKNSARKNILGFDKIYLTNIQSIIGCYQNVVQIKRNNIIKKTSVFTYNSELYPITENVSNYSDTGTLLSTKSMAYFY